MPGGKITPYTEEELSALRPIARRDRKQWRPAIEAAMTTFPNVRTYSAVYAKTDEIARGMGLRSNKFGNNPKVKKVAKKLKTSDPVLTYKKPSVRRHPMKKGDLVVSQKEIRFAFKAIRLENGEVIISI